MFVSPMSQTTVSSQVMTSSLLHAFFRVLDGHWNGGKCDKKINIFVSHLEKRCVLYTWFDVQFEKKLLFWANYFLSVKKIH